MKKTLILGASLNPNTYSNRAIRKLMAHGFAVIGIGIREGTVEGAPVGTEQIPIKELHTISLYLNPANQVFYYDYILALRPQRVIFNPGTENKALEESLKAHGISYERACTLVLLSLDAY